MLRRILSRLTIGKKFLLLFLAYSLFSLSFFVLFLFSSVPFIIALTFGIGIVLIIVIFRTTQSIIQPLLVLRRGAVAISRGNLTEAIIVDSQDELHDLAVSLNEISAKHTAFITDLTGDKEALAEQSERLEVTTKLLFERDAALREFNEELTQKTEMMVAERNKLSIVLSGMTDAVVVVDLSRTIILVNKVACELTGYSEEHLLGKPIDAVVTFLDRMEVVPATVYCPTLNEGFEGIVYRNEGLKLVGAAKRQADVSVIVGQIKEGETINLGCIITLHDITQERQLEEMKLDFVSMAAHELRTPLTAIRGYAELVREECSMTMQISQQEYLRRLIISAENLGNLIDNLLNVSRIEQGIFKLDVGEVDIVELSRNIVVALEGQARMKFQTLSLEVKQEGVPMILADRFRITEVLSNLVANAINYTQPHGTITIQIDYGKNMIAVSVVDTGKGIPKDALPKLFNKFFRVSGVLEQGSKGTGLGLFISKSIITLHRGNIWVESELGKGSTFIFTLPIPSSQEKAAWEQKRLQKTRPGRAENGVFLNTAKNSIPA